MLVFSLCGEPTYITATNFESNTVYHGEWKVSLSYEPATEQLMSIFKSTSPEEVYRGNVELNKECIQI